MKEVVLDCIEECVNGTKSGCKKFKNDPEEAIKQCQKNCFKHFKRRKKTHRFLQKVFGR